MARSPRTAATPSDLPPGGHVEPVDAPAAPSRRATVPIAPREPMTDATRDVVSTVRSALVGAAYTRSADTLRLARDVVAAVAARLNIGAEGREYAAEALEYLDGRIEQVDAQQDAG